LDFEYVMRTYLLGTMKLRFLDDSVGTLFYLKDVIAGNISTYNAMVISVDIAMTL